MSFAVFTDEDYGGGGHDFPLLDSGHDFSLLDGGGGGFIPHLCQKPHSSSEELENNQKKSCDHHRFEPLGLVSDDDEDFDDDDDDEFFDAEYLGDLDASRHFSSSSSPIQGIPLVEVFSVVINTNTNKNINMEKKPPGGQAGVVCVSSLSLYGTISLNDGLTFTPEYIYNTKREDSTSISLSNGGGKKTALLLTGLSRPFAACDTLSIELDLMVDNKVRNSTPDDGDDDDDDDVDVFCRGRIYWHFLTGLCRKYENGKVSSQSHHVPLPYIYDQPLASIFVGRFGSVKVNYAMWWEGVGATVEVTLLNRDGADVYGLIRAGNTCWSSTYWSVLFQKKKKKKSDDSIDVRPGQLIPLSRSFVAVNQSSSLKVSVELYDRRRYRQLSQDDDEIAKGTVDFPAKSSGTSEENISGRYGEIRVKVTWCPG